MYFLYWLKFVKNQNYFEYIFAFSYTRCNSTVSILRIDTAELHRVYDNMLQRAQKCIDVQGDHFQHLL